ncbi:LytR C-terminal domain-containing protein [Rothia sp. HC945]|uniref:LytR C-terminal domain-containing protein n=1 Tax=Rothia sp. HC945 TaxID=3171170 RepID=UPI00264B2196|nr:LytR C-terminal domain-containing protein [Kocuria sp.]MDN5616578.1 LytR C-terminal domain-containing protein [Kocuria sp.]
MAEYEHDEFDDVPADSPRRGAYRGEVPEKTRGYKHLAALIVAGVCALVLGGVFFLLSPKLASPESASATKSSSSSQSSSESSSQAGDSGGSSETEPDSSTSLAVYNQGAAEGTATDAASTLTDAGWKVADVSNWDGPSQDSTVVFYTDGNEDQAKAVADKLNIDNVKPATGSGYDVVVVLSDDGGSSAESGQDGGNAEQGSGSAGEDAGGLGQDSGITGQDGTGIGQDSGIPGQDSGIAGQQ